MQGLLGCGTHTASVWDRDGQKLLDLDDIRFVQYSRELDTHSEATVTVGRGGSCCSMLGMVRPWRHNLVIYRTAPGQPQHEVWSGPIIEPEFGRDETTIYARDAWAWLDRRDIRETVTASGDLSDVGWALIDHGLTHPDGGLDETGIRRHLDKRAAGVPGAREWEDDDGSVGQELRRLCQGALNATFLGPRLVLWGPYPLSRTALLQDANFLDPLSVKLDGWAMVTRAVVRGKGFTATCGGTDPYYGLLEGEVNDDSMTDRRDGQELACLEVATRKQPPLVLSIPDGARLAPDAPVTLDELVPGVEIPVWSKATCLEVNVDLVLTRLKVTDEPTGERVQVALAPGTVLGDEQPDFTPGEV